MPMRDVDSSIAPSVWWLVGLQLAGGLAFLLLDKVTGIDLGGGAGIGLFVGAIYAAVQKFIQDHGRPFSTSERKRFALWGSVWSLCAPAVFMTIGAIVIGEVAALIAFVGGYAAIIFGFALFGIALSYGLIYWISGWAGRLLMKHAPA